MINSNQAFDMLPFMVDIYDKLKIDSYRKNLIEKTKGKTVDKKELGIDLVKYIVKNSKNVKEEFFNIVAIAEEKTIEEIKSQSLVKTIKTFNEIFTDPDLTDFFKSAMQ